MLEKILTHCIAFLVGAFAGAVSLYFGNRFTDRRREKESIKGAIKQFKNVIKQMPELIAEMKEDLSWRENKFVREFFVSRREHTLNTSNPCFVYYENDHPGLQTKIHILENLGYVEDITPGNAPMYRMNEEFVELVRQYG